MPAKFHLLLLFAAALIYANWRKKRMSLSKIAGRPPEQQHRQTVNTKAEGKPE